MWWSSYSSRCESVPVDIVDGSAVVETVRVNQRDKATASAWHDLGTFTFHGTAQVVVRAQDSTCSTCADAVRFQLPEGAGLESLEILGPAAILPGVPTGYECRAWYDDGSSRLVDPVWWVDDLGTPASITRDGVLVLEAREPYETDLQAFYRDDGKAAVATSPIALVGSPGELVVDNGDPGTSATGWWPVSGGRDPYGADSLYSKSSDATYTFEADVRGTYSVLLHWSEWTSRCGEVRVELYDGTSLVDTATVDQAHPWAAPLWYGYDEQGVWWAEVFYHEFTGRARVKILSTGPGCSTCADAARWVRG
jgi:hypothetical protein